MSLPPIVRMSAFIGAFLAVGTSTGYAQQADCRFLKVSTVALNIFKEPNAASQFVERLNKDDIVCSVGRDRQVGEFVWTYVVFKLEKQNQRKTLDGWGILRFMKEATTTELAALRGPPEPPPPTPPAAAPTPTPDPAPPPAPDAPVTRSLTDDVIRFSDPIPFGPYPVNGHSLQELMIAAIALFPPIEGLDDSVWKKTCNNCHKWDRTTLCTQAGTYAKNPKTELRIPHPYGGAEKIAMMKWFQGGCQ